MATKTLTATTNTNAGGSIYNYAYSWSDARNESSGDSVLSSNNQTICSSQFDSGDGNKYKVIRGSAHFDISSIPTGATIESVTLRLKRDSGSQMIKNNSGNYSIHIVSNSMSDNHTLSTSDFSKLKSTTTYATKSESSISNGSSDVDFTFNSTGISYIQDRIDNGGAVRTAIREGMDYGGDEPSSENALTNVKVDETELIITYTPKAVGMFLTF